MQDSWYETPVGVVTHRLRTAEKPVVDFTVRSLTDTAWINLSMLLWLFVANTETLACVGGCDAEAHTGFVIFLPRTDNPNLNMIQQGRIYVAGQLTERLDCSLHVRSRTQCSGNSWGSCSWLIKEPETQKPSAESLGQLVSRAESLIWLAVGYARVSLVEIHWSVQEWRHNLLQNGSENSCFCSVLETFLWAWNYLKFLILFSVWFEIIWTLKELN